MRNFLSKRGFAVFTSLALCASLVAPSFAATFADLQSVIDSNEDVTEGEILREGNKITLNGKVERTDTDEQPITIGGSHGNITLDLNGQTIDGTGGNGKASFLLQGGTLTIEDSTGGGEVKGGNSNGVVNMTGASNLTLNGGTISDNANGTGVKVNGGASFTMNGGTISGNTNSGVQVNGGSFAMTGGEISKNTASSGAGVNVSGGGSFTMTGGEISGNTAEYSGGGIGVRGEGSSFTMKGGAVSGNTAKNTGGDSGGGGVWIKSGAGFTMDGGEITNNKVTKKDGTGIDGNGGGVAIHQAEFTMNGGKIYGNESSRGIGVLINAGSNNGGDASFTMTGGYVKGQDGKSCIYLEEEEGSGKNAVFNLSGNAVMDGSIFLGSGTQVITEDVVNKDDSHIFTKFDVLDSDTQEATDEITPDETDKAQTNGEGYEPEEDTLLDIKYGHVFGSEWVSDGPNTHSHVCEVCPATADTASHQWTETSRTEAKCETAGEIISKCKDCGETKAETIPAKSHNWDDGKVTKAATCEEEGETTFTCTVCGATNPETEPIAALNHKLENGSDAVSDEWDSDKDNHWHTCELCGEAVFGSEPHNWDDGVVMVEPTTEAEGETTFTCKDCKTTKTEPINRLPDTGNGGGDTIIDDPDVPLGGLPDFGGETEVEIEEPDVPLAGLFTRADAIGYLWEQAGSPDVALSDFSDVPADHEWAVAIGWAQDMGIALPDLDGNFHPDDLLERSVEDIELKPEGEFEQFLNRYAEFAGIELEPDELFIELFGEPDEIIMGEDAQVIFDSFFDRLELALAQAA